MITSKRKYAYQSRILTHLLMEFKALKSSGIGGFFRERTQLIYLAGWQLVLA